MEHRGYPLRAFKLALVALKGVQIAYNQVRRRKNRFEIRANIHPLCPLGRASGEQRHLLAVRAQQLSRTGGALRLPHADRLQRPLRIRPLRSAAQVLADLLPTREPFLYLGCPIDLEVGRSARPHALAPAPRSDRRRDHRHDALSSNQYIAQALRGVSGLFAQGPGDILSGGRWPRAVRELVGEREDRVQGEEEAHPARSRALRVDL